MTDQGRRTAAVVAAVAIAFFSVLVVSSLRSNGQRAGGRTDTDGAFIAAMVSHHSAAVQMAQIALDRSKRRDVKRLAQQIVASQTEEMGTLRMIHQRLFGAPLSTMSSDHGAMSGMSGEMGAAPAELQAAPEFDRAFLDAMLPHHEDAIRMARLELANGRDPPLRRLARSIVDVQSREITEMRTWRQRWYGPRLRSRARSAQR